MFQSATEWSKPSDECGFAKNKCRNATYGLPTIRNGLPEIGSINYKPYITIPTIGRKNNKHVACHSTQPIHLRMQ